LAPSDKVSFPSGERTQGSIAKAGLAEAELIFDHLFFLTASRGRSGLGNRKSQSRGLSIGEL
jgi:hypothetical protein